MLGKAIHYIVFISLLIGVSGFSQIDFSEGTTNPNGYFNDSVLTKATNEDIFEHYNLEDLVMKYYTGLGLLDQVEDSLKLRFFDEYSMIFTSAKLFDESNKLAKQGVKLTKEVSSNFDIGKFYNHLSFNYLGLHKYDSVTWAYKKIIDENLKAGLDIQNVSNYNNLGYHYFLNVKKNDSALFYLNKSQEIPSVHIAYSSSLTLRWSIKDNIALVYMDQGRYTEAGALFKEIYEHYGKSRRGYWWRERWLRSGLQYVDVKLKLGNFAEARNSLVEIDNHFNKLPDYQSSSREYFESKQLLLKTKRQYAQSVGDFKKAEVLGDIYFKLRDSLNTSSRSQLLKDINLLRETGLENAQRALKREQALSVVEKKNLALDLKRKSVRVYWLLSLSILLGVIVFGYFHFRRARQFNAKQAEILTEYSQNLIKTQEEERERLSRELHDSLGQKLMLLTKKTKGTGDAVMESLAGSSLEEIRSVARALHPSMIEKLGISKALEDLVNQIDSRTPIFFTHEIDSIDGILDAATALQVYRIIQESLNNMVKYSETKSAAVLVKSKGNHIDISVKDRGKGFGFSEELNSSRRLSMRTLFERAQMIESKLNITSSPQHGTEVHLSVPFSS